MTVQDLTHEQFQPIVDGNADLAVINSMRNMTEINSELYFTEYVLNAAGIPVWEQQLYKIGSLTGAKELVTDFTGTTRDRTGNYNTYTRQYGDNIISIVAHQYGTSQLSMGSIWSIDGGSSWNTQDYWAGAISGVAGANSSGVDAFVINGDIWQFFTVLYGTTPSVYRMMFDQLSGGAGSVITNMYHAQDIYAGVVYDGKYRFIYRDLSGDWQIATFDGTTVVNIEQLDFTAPINVDVYRQQYWIQGNYEYIIDLDNFQYRRLGTTDWGPFTGSGESAVGIVWDKEGLDNYRINYIIWKDGIYKTDENGRVSKIQQINPRDYKKTVGDPLTDLPGVVQVGTKRYPSLGDWTEVTTPTIFTVIKTFDGHDNTVQQTQATVGRVALDFTAVTSADFEFAFGRENTTEIAYCGLASGTTPNAVIRLGLASIFEYYTNNSRVAFPSGLTYVANTNYDCRIQWVSNTSLKIWVNGNLEVDRTSNVYNGTLGRFLWVTVGTSYLDALGFQKDGYVVGSTQAITATVGFNDWFADGNDRIYQLADVVVPIENAALVSRKLYRAPLFTIISRLAPFLDQYFELKDADGVLIFEGAVVSYVNSKERVYIWEIVSGIKTDLERKITASFVATSVPDILKAICDEECDYLFYGEGDNGLVNRFTEDQIDGSDDDWTNDDDANTFSTYMKEKQLTNGLMIDVLQQYDNSGAGNAFIRKDDISGITVVSLFASYDTASLLFFRFYNAGTSLFYLWYTGGAYVVTGGSGTDTLLTAPLNEKHHFAFVMDETGTYNVDCYADGVFIINVDYSANSAFNRLDINTGTATSGGTAWYSKIYFGNSLVEALNTYNSISPLFTTLQTIDFNGLSVADIHKWADTLAGYVSTYQNNNQLYWDQYRPSARFVGDVKSLRSISDDDIAGGDDDIDIQTLKYSRAVLYGGYAKGKPLRKVVIAEPNFGTWTDWYPQINTQAKLDAQAAKVISARNITFQLISPVLFNVGVMQMGEYVKVVSTGLDLDGTENWLAIALTYNPYTLELIPILCDSFYQGKQKTNPTEQSTRNNEQNIGVLAQKQQLNQIDDITLDADDTTPDLSLGSSFITPANTGATAITDLDNPTAGQIITLVIGSATNPSSIADAAPFYLSGAWAPALYDSITLKILDATHFIELSRVNV